MLLKSGISVADLIAANLSALSIIVALAQRDRNGQGCQIDVSMQSALAWMTQLEWNASPGERKDAAMLSCADGYVYAPESGEHRRERAVCRVGGRDVDRLDHHIGGSHQRVPLRRARHGIGIGLDDLLSFARHRVQMPRGRI